MKERIKETEEEESTSGMDEDGPPPGYSDPLPFPPSRMREVGYEEEDGEGTKEEEKEDDGPPPGYSNSISHQPTCDMAQMVCGLCRQLLLYPLGARHVQCSSCQRLNYVLEAHQVGQVKCGGCTVLLMYPYGASRVRCSTCRFITDIGEINIRPPLSVQQAQATAAPYSVH